MHWYMAELTSRVVSRSGIPSDRFHLGKIVLQSLMETPDHITQTDAATGESETSRSLLERSVKFAVCLRKMGYKKGDVAVVVATSHIDVAVVIYASLYLGMTVATLDVSLSVLELKGMFQVNRANLVFCDVEKMPIINEAMVQIGIKSNIITFEKRNGTVLSDYSFSNIMKNNIEEDVESFRAENLDPEEAIAFLISSSGTTGLPKVVALTHKNLTISFAYFWSHFFRFPSPTRLVFSSSSLQWVTGILFMVTSPVMRVPRLQSSATLTQALFVHIVHTYKPSFSIMSPTFISSMVKSGIKVDLTCFDDLMLGGMAVSENLIEELKRLTPNTKVHITYGCSEIGGIALSNQHHVYNSIGRPVGLFEYKLVNVDTNESITEPFVKGELWLRGAAVGKGYHNNPDMSKEVFLSDGWLRTGDIMYRDEHYNFYFVERLKMVLKYKGFQISPTEIENVIYGHGGVLHAAVTGVPHEECGDLPVACVVPRPGHTLTAQEIKDLVKETLSVSKHLREVIFMNELPMTVSSKIDRATLKRIVMNRKHVQ